MQPWPTSGASPARWNGSPALPTRRRLERRPRWSSATWSPRRPLSRCCQTRLWTVDSARRLRLGTRGSRLALVQSELVADRLRAAGHDVELVAIVTEGDVRPLDMSPGEGVFVAAIARAPLESLAGGAIVGADSPRRTGFLLAARPDLKVVPLHGNVETRLRRLDDGAADALVLAAAGIDRLGRQERIDQRLDPEVVAPAPGQGALAVQVRRAD